MRINPTELPESYWDEDPIDKFSLVGKIMQCEGDNGNLSLVHTRFVRRLFDSNIMYVGAVPGPETYGLGDEIPPDAMKDKFVMTVAEKSNSEPVSIEPFYPLSGPILFREYINATRDFFGTPKSSKIDIYDRISRLVRGTLTEADFYVMSDVAGDSYLVTFSILPIKAGQESASGVSSVDAGVYRFDWENQVFRKAVLISRYSDRYAPAQVLAFQPDHGTNFYFSGGDEFISPPSLQLRIAPTILHKNFFNGSDKEAEHVALCREVMDYSLSLQDAPVTVVGRREDVGGDILPVCSFSVR